MKTGSRHDALRIDGRKGEDPGVRAAQAMKPTRTSSQRQKRSTIKNRLLSAQDVQRFGTWNMSTLPGLGKTEQLAREMRCYWLSSLAVTETHLPGVGDVVLEEESGYNTIFSGRQDERNMEGVGLALTPLTRATM